MHYSSNKSLGTNEESVSNQLDPGAFGRICLASLFGLFFDL